MFWHDENPFSPESGYELDWQRLDSNGHYRLVGILTGHETEDIIAASPDRSSWWTRDYVHVFRTLGFNVNDRFKKFDPNTEYPCILRYTHSDDKKHWHGEAYYQNKIFIGNGVWFDFNEWFESWEGKIRVTSMLQVWL